MKAKHITIIASIDHFFFQIHYGQTFPLTTLRQILPMIILQLQVSQTKNQKSSHILFVLHKFYTLHYIIHTTSMFTADFACSYQWWELFPNKNEMVHFFSN